MLNADITNLARRELKGSQAGQKGFSMEQFFHGRSTIEPLYAYRFERWGSKCVQAVKQPYGWKGDGQSIQLGQALRFKQHAIKIRAIVKTRWWKR
jgi:hypothetical protein